MTYGLNIDERDVSAAQFRLAIVEILTAAELVALATTDFRGPHASPVYFATAPDLALYFTSERTTRHTRGLPGYNRMSGAVWIEPPVYGEQLRGLQLSGSAVEVEPGHRRDALSIYAQRFPGFINKTGDLAQTLLLGEGTAALYRFQVSRLKLLDEPRFGRRRYLNATVTR